MKKFFILLKYGFIGVDRWGSKKRKRKRISVLISYIFVLFFYGFMVILFKDVFANIKKMNINLFYIAGYYFILLFSVMGLLNLIPFFIFSLVKNNETEFLATLPIKKVYIYFYQLILTLKDNILFIGSLITIIMGYSLNYSQSISSIIYTFFAAFIYVLNIIFISIYFSILLAKLFSKRTARFFAYIFMIFIFLFFVFIIQFREQLNSFIQSPDNINKIYLILRKVNFIRYDRGPIHLFMISLYKKEVILYFILSGIISGGFLYYILNNMDYSHFYRVTKKKSKSIFKYRNKNNKGIVLSGFIFKDLKLIIRNEKAVFMLIYPLLFGIIYALVLKSLYGALFISIALSSFYTIIISIMLLFEELKIKNLSFTFPLKVETIISTKLVIPIFYNLSISIIILLIFVVALKASFVLFLLIPFIFIIDLFASFIGIYFVSINDKSFDYKYPDKALNFGMTLLFEFIIFILTFIIVQIPALLLNNNEEFLKIISKKFVLKMAAYLLPVLLSSGIVIFVYKNIKKIGKKLVS